MSVVSEAPTTTNQFGYQSFEIGGVTFSRDEYYAELRWGGGSHTIEIDQFIRTAQRLHAFRFFVGSFLFDEVVGFTNKYGSVDFGDIQSFIKRSASQQCTGSY